MNKINIYKNSYDGSKDLAKILIKEINSIILKKGYCTIGLPTGNSPLKLYEELVNSYKNNLIQFKNVILFNLDEFYPIRKDSKDCYRNYLYDHLLDHVDFNEKNLYFLDSEIKEEELANYCDLFEKKIIEVGGLDIQVLGIGINGHIGFNEPGSKIESKTRKVKISNESYKTISKDFKETNKIPREALTLGIKTILSSCKIYLMAWGIYKSSVIKKAIKGKIISSCPASYLRNHNDVTYFLDEMSSSKL